MDSTGWFRLRFNHAPTTQLKTPRKVGAAGALDGIKIHNVFRASLFGGFAHRRWHGATEGRSIQRDYSCRVWDISKRVISHTGQHIAKNATK